MLDHYCIQANRR